MLKWYITIAIVAYLIGSVSFSVIFTKRFAGFDVREKGSKNAGTTNVLRTAGKLPALLTLICDILKGCVAVLLGLLLGKMLGPEVCDENAKAVLCDVAGIAVIIGHTFPIFFGFRGGKGVATGLGTLLVINWKIGLICLVFGLLMILFTRMVSVGSMSAAVLFPVLCLFMREGFIVDENYFGYIIYGVIVAAILLFNHRSNIQRLFNGDENKLSFKSKSSENNGDQKDEKESNNQDKTNSDKKDND